MACYHPLFSTTSFRADGKKDVKIWTAAAVAAWELRTGKEFIKRSDFLPLPCGKCIGCRLEYSRQWAIRCMAELKYHDSAYFVTLTYNDEHLPLNSDPETGELVGNGTLCKRDFQLFMKRLRKAFSDQKIRFFACGEYGSNWRPHYHAIIFGLKLSDLKIYSIKADGTRLYTSDSLMRVWSDENGEIGYVVIGDVTFESCAYVARYVTKKLSGKESSKYEELGMLPEFCLMSRRPGIGRSYYDDHKEEMMYEFMNIPSEKRGIRFRPPVYYNRLFEVDEPEKASDRREMREKIVRINMENRLLISDLNFDNQLLADEVNFSSENKKRLSRKGEF